MRCAKKNRRVDALDREAIVVKVPHNEFCTDQLVTALVGCVYV